MVFEAYVRPAGVHALHQPQRLPVPGHAVRRDQMQGEHLLRLYERVLDDQP